MGKSDEMRGQLAFVVHLNQLKSEKSTLPVFVFLLLLKDYFFCKQKNVVSTSVKDNKNYFQYKYLFRFQLFKHHFPNYWIK